MPRSTRTLRKKSNGLTINSNTIIGAAILLLTAAGTTIVTHKVNTSLDRQETNAKVVAEVPTKIEEIKREITAKAQELTKDAENNRKITGLEIGAVQQDVTTLKADVKEGKQDIKEVKESQTKLITRDELNKKVDVLKAVEGIADKLDKKEPHK